MRTAAAAFLTLVATSAAATGSDTPDRQSLADAWKDKAPDVTIETRAERGRPADVLEKASHDSDLLLVARARTWVPGHHLGSVARAVLREAACPVEVVPEPRG